MRATEVHYPPISTNGIGKSSFDLPLLTIGNSVPQNPEVQFRPNSCLMILKGTLSRSSGHPSYAYYFLWRQSRWTLLRKVLLVQP